MFTYGNLDQYHPHRSRKAWQALEEHCENRDIDFDTYYYTAAEMLSEWGSRRNLTTQDQAMLHDVNWLECLLEDRCGEAVDHTIILDARSIVAGLNSEEVDETIFDSFPRKKSNSRNGYYYVHFGPSAFPSPFTDIGVEGAYVDVSINPGKESGMDVSVTLVCSDPYADLLEPEENKSAGMYLLDTVRSVTLHLNPANEPDFLWDANVTGFETSGDPNDRQWASFYRAPMTAALKIMEMHFTNSVEYTPALPMGSDPGLARVLAKSSSDSHWSNVASEIENGFAVRFLGGVPSTSLPIGPSFDEKPITEDYIAAMIDDAYELEDVKAGLQLAEKALKMADQIQSGELVKARLGMKAHASVVELALAARDSISALSSGNQIANSPSVIANAYLPLAWLAHKLAGYEEQLVDELKLRCETEGWQELIEAGERTIKWLQDEGFDDVIGHFMEHPIHRRFHHGALSQIAFQTPYDPAFGDEWHITAWSGEYPAIDEEFRSTMRF